MKSFIHYCRIAAIKPYEEYCATRKSSCAHCWRVLCPFLILQSLILHASSFFFLFPAPLLLVSLVSTLIWNIVSSDTALAIARSPGRVCNRRVRGLSSGLRDRLGLEGYAHFVKMDNDIEEVKKAIEKVEQQILAVEQELTKKSAKEDVAYFRKKDEQLREKEWQLREKERQLREEKLLLLKSDTSEGGPSSKKARRSVENYYPAYAVDAEESKAAIASYYGKLLEAASELPIRTRDLQTFLSASTEKLPLVKRLYSGILQTESVKLWTLPEEEDLAVFLSFIFPLMKGPLKNEAYSSSDLRDLTGKFFEHLNDHAPEGKQLGELFFTMDSPNPGTSRSALSALLPRLRPDFQLFVGGVLMLRWENKIDKDGILEAKEENKKKLKVWSPLYYGKLPYVIGGCCGGTTFRWLKLFPNGDQIAADFISRPYDLSTSSGMAKFLQSIIRMHCLLKKLEVELGDHIPVKLYVPDRRTGDGEVIIHPDFVEKLVKPPWEKEEFRMFKRLYDSIKGSRYLIQLQDIRSTRSGTQLLLKPVGYPHAKPDVLKDLKDAVHDILHGLKDLHEQGYTHRDLRWPNVIKVNVMGEWKWVIIDLEAAGPDGEEWDRALLKDWDEGTLTSTRRRKKIYSKGSDMYQLGKLIVEWFGGHIPRDVEGRRLYELGKKMREQRPVASTMLGEICEPGCERCGKLDRRG